MRTTPRPAGTSRSTHPDPTDFAGTSHLEATGDTLTLKAFYDLVCAIAHQLFLDGDTDPLGARKIKALGMITACTGQTARRPRTQGQGLRPRRRRRPRVDADGGSALAVGEIEKLGAATLTKIRALGRPPPGRHPTRPEHGPRRRRRRPRPTRLDARPRHPPRRPLHLPPLHHRRQRLRPRPHHPLPTRTAHPAKPDPTTSPASAGDTTAPRPADSGDTPARPTAATTGTAPTARRTSSRPR